MISSFFIHRPVLANTLALVTLLLGAVSILRLPVAQYPDVVPPTVQVSTVFPGASATTIARTVALPIEQQVNGVSGMLYMQSYSSDAGTYTLTVTFAIGTDPDAAQVLVQNRVGTALASLPGSVQTQGVKVEKRSTSVLSFVALRSPDGSRDSLFLSNYASINLVNELKRLKGVGDVTVFGASDYAMRIWLDPGLLQARGLTAPDIVRVLQQQSQIVTSGQLGAPPAPASQAFQYTLNVAGRFDEAAQFEDIIVKSGTGAGGQITRLRDVARVELGAQTYAQDFQLNGSSAIGMGIYVEPAANALAVQKAVGARMAELAAAFPPGVAFSVPFDTTKFVNASIHEVYTTLIETAVLVLAVILLFLQDWRAMMIPATTVPVTIVGAFAAMAALGFGINMSTLFAIVLAIGIVVDDAIIIVEGATHWLEQGEPPPRAAERAMESLLGPVIGITLVLMSVFTPAAFLPGLTGRMYAQFALVIAATALISAVNALTLKPTQCAGWLRVPTPPERRNIVFRGFNCGYAWLERRYQRLVGFILRHSRAGVAVGLVFVVGAVAGLSRIPTGFLPLEDQGYFLVSVQLPDGASLGRTKAAVAHAGRLVQAVPGVDQVLSISGVSVTDNSAPLANSGALYVVLKDWSQRGADEGLLPTYQALTRALAGVEEARTQVIPPPAIQGIGNAGGFSMQVELQNNSLDWQGLQNATGAVVAAAATQSAVRQPSTSFSAEAPQYEVKIDRRKAETLGVAIQDVFASISASLGSSYAGQFDRFGQTFQVFAQNQADSRLTPGQMEQIHVRNASGQMIPLGSLLSIVPAAGPSLVSFYNLYPSATILGSPQAGFSSGQAIGLMEQVAAARLPLGAGYEWTAMSFQEKAVGSQIYYVFGLALVLVYFVLAGQYGSWLTPLAVLLAVPLALVGPVIAMLSLGIDNNLYTQIGLILLVALAAKNAILIVEVALERHEAGVPIAQAAAEAAVARFRPILMTSIAFALGVVPLIAATGAGANARKAIGITTFSGMISATLLAVILVPAFFVVIRSIEERRRR